MNFDSSDLANVVAAIGGLLLAAFGPAAAHAILRATPDEEVRQEGRRQLTVRMVSAAFQISSAFTSTLYVAILAGTNLAFRGDRLEAWQRIPGWVVGLLSLAWIVTLLVGRFSPDVSLYVPEKPTMPWPLGKHPPWNALTWTRYVSSVATVALAIIFSLGS